MTRLARPITTQPHYGEHLGDAAYWSPWITAALSANDLPIVEIESPFVGTFPTFLVGDVVVKLFADVFDGGRSFSTEKAMHELLASHRDIPTPVVVGAGELFSSGWRWPYLVTERFQGEAIRAARSSNEDWHQVAAGLGGLCTRLHRLAPPAAVAARDLLPALRGNAANRLTRFGLPRHLADQVPAYLADASDERVLVHADITEDHVFVSGRRLVGVIDWGDAVVADPSYELVALYFGALDAEPRLLTTFLDSYGWGRGEDFPRRALQGVLEFQFDAISRIRQIVDLDRLVTLDELADSLFGPFV